MLQTRKVTCGGDAIEHEVSVFDPLEVFGENGALQSSGAELRTPHFFLKQGDVPAKMVQMAATIKSADCFVIVTPEYNHSIPPALSSMMSHFGASNYAYKMSAIVTYSPGPWGGMRAAMALRPFLSELGCLPVSKLTAIPVAHELLDENGVPRDSANRMFQQLPAMMEQLEWFTIACLNQRATTGI